MANAKPASAGKAAKETKAEDSTTRGSTEDAKTHAPATPVGGEKEVTLENGRKVVEKSVPNTKTGKSVTIRTFVD